MKRHLVLVILLFLNLTIFAQEFTHPAAYNNFIVEEMNEIVTKNLEYISQSVHSQNYEQIELKRQNLVKQIKIAYQAISQQPPYEKGELLQSECIAVLKIYQQVFEVELQEANLLKQTSEESFEAMEAYFKSRDIAEKNLEKATDRFYKAQKAFIKIHNIPVENVSENTEIEAQFKNMAEVNAYIRALYLMNFQLSKYNAIFFEAVGNKDVAGLDAKRKRIESAANTSLSELSKMSDFKGDRDLLEKTIDIVEFYQEMSSKGFVDIVKVLEAKPEAITQADVNKYNEAIQQFNSRIQGLTNDVNQAQNDLLKKHIPKYNIMNKDIKRT